MKDGKSDTRDMAQILTALTMFVLFGCMAIILLALAFKAGFWILGW